jgi:glycosyltransferase involved in cell wall biosynthesis
LDNTHAAASLSGSGSSQTQAVGFPRRVAVVHDWLDKVGGAERVLEEILRCFPEADLFALVDALSDADRSIVFGKNAQTTFIQKLPGARRFFRLYLPLMPLAIEQLDLTSYDLIISSSWAFAKGVITGPEQLHVAYVHTPIRYAWDQQHRYLRQMGSSLGVRRGIVRLALHWVRLWDLRTVAGVDIWVANSSNVSQRIRKTYRQSALVVYPPVSTDDFPFSRKKKDFYLTCSRLVSYKRLDLIVDAFRSTPERRLVVAGEGPEAVHLRRLAGGAANIEFVGRRSDLETRELMKQARALIFAANEDFGIVLVEAQACGTPIVAYAKGGALETVRGLDARNPTGVFFYEQSAAAINDAIGSLEQLPHPIDAASCRANADRFDSPVFRARLMEIVREGWAELKARSSKMPRERTVRAGNTPTLVAPLADRAL